jgi:CDP-6-deoxy-D-xylo-4-hexulose-3-dehydrase
MDKNGRKNGTKYAGSFSFYFGHHMTTIEGGMLSTSDSELYDLMKMKRSHGMARESIWFDKYAKENPNIIKSFLFMTDGYNFRNTDLAATLGLSQLKRLDKMIEIRNNNARKYTSLLSPYREMFIMAGYPDHRNSSFAFPFISRNVSIHNNFVKLLQEVKIEYRPIVSGNLLVQPFLKNYSLGLSNPNVNILNERGCYIGNNHFVGRKEFKLLESVLERLCE